MLLHRTASVATWVLIFALALGALAEPAAEAGTDAVAVIDRFRATLIDVMKHAKELGFEGRREQLQPVMEETYDFSTMAKRSLGPAWSKLDDAQQARFDQVFSAMILRTYATRFNGYESEHFETLGTEPSIAGTEIVRTVLHTAKEDVQLDYRLRATPKGWRVIDVYLGGTISELALRRAEYTAVLDRDGFDALVRALERKIAEGPAFAPANSDSLLK